MIRTIVEGVRKPRPVNCPVTGGHAWQGGNRHLRAEQDDLYVGPPMAAAHHARKDSAICTPGLSIPADE
jgi:hypothetical protein